MRSGNLSGAIAVFHQVTHDYPNLPKGHCNLGAALLNNDDLPGAIVAYRQAIDLRNDFAPAFVLLGSALSMDGDLPGAIDAFERAVELQPGDAMSHCNLGLCLKDQGEFVAALAALRRGHELGSKQAAWPIPSARYVAECERLVELDAQLLDVLTGRLQPEAAALGEFANVCYCKRRYADAVRLYRTAFDRQPQLADNLSKNWRYNAACAAALGGCAREKGEPGVSEMDRAELRRQALEWLSADLEQWKQFLRQSPAQARGLAARFLPRWQGDADLGPVRDPEQLARLPDEERQRLAAFWDDVAQTIATVEHESGK
jgi:tetratricopeptide (TPR) repeat protein